MMYIPLMYTPLIVGSEFIFGYYMDTVGEAHCWTGNSSHPEPDHLGPLFDLLIVFDSNLENALYG